MLFQLHEAHFHFGEVLLFWDNFFDEEGGVAVVDEDSRLGEPWLLFFLGRRRERWLPGVEGPWLIWNKTSI